MDWKYPYILVLLVIFIAIWMIWLLRNKIQKNSGLNSINERLAAKVDFRKQAWKQRFRVYGLVLLIIAAGRVGRCIVL